MVTSLQIVTNDKETTPLYSSEYKHSIGSPDKEYFETNDSRIYLRPALKPRGFPAFGSLSTILDSDSKERNSSIFET